MPEYFRLVDPERAEAERRIATFVCKKNLIYCKMQQQQKTFARFTVFFSAHVLPLTKKSRNHCCSTNSLKGKLMRYNAWAHSLLLLSRNLKVE